MDARNPEAPPRADRIELPETGSSLAILGNTLYLGMSGSRVTPYDLLDPARPVAGRTVELPGQAGNIVATADRLVSVRRSDDGLQLASFRPDGSAGLALDALLPIGATETWGLAADESYAYFITDQGPHIVNLAAPSAPSVIAFGSLPFTVNGLRRFGSRLAMASGVGGLRVLRLPERWR